MRDVVTAADIGAFESERGVTQRLRFNVVVEVRSAEDPAGSGDDVDRILSYDEVTQAITSALAIERVNLLETLSEHVANGVLIHPQADRVFVRVEKLDRGPGALGVEIERRATPIPQATRQALVPDVAFLTPEAIQTPDLGQRIAGLRAGARPLVICVGPEIRPEIGPEIRPETAPAPATGPEHYQERIDLLAIEQAAWALAARDARCTVVASRTELDWAMREGLISVWAPSKIVLAATGDVPSARDPVALAAWFATLLGAGGLTMIETPGRAQQAS